MSTADGVYTSDQAAEGKPLYAQHCIMCHDKKYFRPVFRRLQGQTLKPFFDEMAGTMPETNPGALYDEEYVSLLAYMLSLSRRPAGDAPLSSDAALLERIVIE